MAATRTPGNINVFLSFAPVTGCVSHYLVIKRYGKWGYRPRSGRFPRTSVDRRNGTRNGSGVLLTSHRVVYIFPRSITSYCHVARHRFRYVVVVVVIVSSSQKEHPQVPNPTLYTTENIIFVLFFFIEMRMDDAKNVISRACSLMIYLFVIFIGNGNITIFPNVFRLLISWCLQKLIWSFSYKPYA